MVADVKQWGINSLCYYSMKAERVLSFAIKKIPSFEMRTLPQKHFLKGIIMENYLNFCG